MNATEFVALLPDADITQRDELLVAAAEAGDVVLDFVEVYLGERLQIRLMADALKFGDPNDCVRLGASGVGQARILQLLGMVHLTPLLADLHAQIALDSGGLVGPFTREPLGITGDTHSMTTDAMVRHSRHIDANLPSEEPDAVSSFKHRVIFKKVFTGSRAKTHNGHYGWHMPSGGNKSASDETELRVVQKFNQAHSARTFADYSEFITGADRCATLDGEDVDLGDVMMGLHGEDAALLVSHEGALPSVLPPYLPLDPGAVSAEEAETDPPPSLDPPEPTKHGDKGPKVTAWQEHLIADAIARGVAHPLPIYGADGGHGDETDAASFAYFKAHAPTPDTVTEPDTVPGSTMPYTFDDGTPGSSFDAQFDDLVDAFIEARNYGRMVRDVDTIRTINLHSTENKVRQGRKQARSVARWFNGPSAPTASATFLCDDEEIIQGVPLLCVSWAAPGANKSGINIEIVGQAMRTNWLGEGLAAITNAARVTGRLCTVLDIPPARLYAKDLQESARGIVSHATVSVAFRRSTHQDPGGPDDRRWPWAEFLRLVEQHM